MMPVVLWINRNRSQSHASDYLAKTFDKEDDLSDTAHNSLSSNTITSQSPPLSPVDDICDGLVKFHSNSSSQRVAKIPLLSEESIRVVIREEEDDSAIGTSSPKSPASCTALTPLPEEELAVVPPPKNNLGSDVPQTVTCVDDDTEEESSVIDSIEHGPSLPLHERHDDDDDGFTAPADSIICIPVNITHSPSDVSNGKDLDRAQQLARSQSHREKSLRKKRRAMEAWNTKQRSRIQVLVTEFESETMSTLNIPIQSVHEAKNSKKTEVARNRRMIERLKEAEIHLHEKAKNLDSETQKKKGKSRIRAIQQKAETKLRISHIKKARGFYQRRLMINSTGPVPMEVLKIVSNLPRKLTLAEELDAYMQNLKDGDRETITAMYQEIEDWEDDEDLALDIGESAPDFSLLFCSLSNARIHLDSKVLRRHRLVVVFYHDSESPMCIMNLAALETLKKAFEREGVRLIGIGFETDTKETASRSGASFPLLADEAGITATKFGIIRTESRPILSTFIIATDGTILWKYVNVDYTKRPEPLEILEAIPTQNKRRRNFFWRDKLQVK
jgi:peroxiredoxin